MMLVAGCIAFYLTEYGYRPLAIYIVAVATFISLQIDRLLNLTTRGRNTGG